MARPRQTAADRDLDSLLTLWAEWVSNGRVMTAVSTASFQSRVMAGGPEALLMMTACSGGSREPIMDAQMEAIVEGAVGQLAYSYLNAADVLRMEFNAGRFEVLQRRKRPTRTVFDRQRDRAEALGMSMRTYRRRLGEARAYVSGYLREQGYGG